MKLVIDANVVISAIIRDGVTRKLLLHPALELVTPAYLFDELEEHREEIMRKAGLDILQFRQFITLLGKVIEVMPSRAYEAYVEEARRVLTDPDDLPYAACAIALTIQRPGLPEPGIIEIALKDEAELDKAAAVDLDECGIWTNDPHFFEKETEFLQRFGVKIWKTNVLHQLMSS